MLREILLEMDRRYEQRFEAMDRAVLTAIATTKEATGKAETAAEKRFEALNELRGVVQDILAKTMPRTETETELLRIREKSDEHSDYDTRTHAQILDRITAIDKRVDQITSHGVGQKDTQAAFRANVALFVSLGLFIITVLTIILRVAWPVAK